MADAAVLPILLRQLRLPTMAACCDEVTHAAIEHGWSTSQTLATLCEHELDECDQRGLQRHLKEARLPAGKTLTAFDLSTLEAHQRQRLSTLATHRHHLDQPGPQSAGLRRIRARQEPYRRGTLPCPDRARLRVRYFPASGLVQELQVAKEGLHLAETLHKLDKYRLLIIDDIGSVKRTEAETTVLFELIAHRYKSGSVLITSKHPFSARHSICADDVMAVAVIDRLVHHADIHHRADRRKPLQVSMRDN